MSAQAVPDLKALSDPAAAAWLCAVDPAGLGGIVVRSRPDEVRDRWLALFRALLPAEAPFRRLPLHADENRVFGGLDLAATLASGRPVAERGVLAATDGGVLVLSMAERVPVTLASRLGAVLDTGTVAPAGGAATDATPARFAIVALDEGMDADERVATALLDRVAFRIDLAGFDPREPKGGGGILTEAARALYASVAATDDSLQALGEAAAVLGVDSLRAGVLALRAARAAAALAGRTAIGAEDAALAARLVLAPRATRLPADAPIEPPPEHEHEQTADQRDGATAEDDETKDAPAEEPMGDLVLAAAKAAIPPGLLERLQAEAAAAKGRQQAGRSGVLQRSTVRGRPSGLRRGKPGGGARLNIIATLRAAAPWQRLRAAPEGAARRVEIRGDDLRLTRFTERAVTTIIFAVDASGSLAVNRLAEAKGAVELLLADCYVRRDQVALLAFRGTTAELLLPPTRSLARAKRCLAELPGGGATPLARGIDTAVLIADQLRRRGQSPVVVFVTDGRANVARDGTTGRARAEQDAQAAAKAAAATGLRMLLVDAAQRPQAPAAALAASLGALYIPLPRADAGALSRTIRAAT